MADGRLLENRHDVKHNSTMDGSIQMKFGTQMQNNMQTYEDTEGKN